MVSSTVVPSATNERTTSQTSLRLRGSWPVGRLVEEQHARREDEARREVEPPPHPARVVLGLLARRVGEPEALEQLVRAPPRGPRREVEQPPEHLEVLASGEDVVDRVVLAGEADPEADLARRRAPRRARPRARRPSRSRSSVEKMRTAVVLPAPLGPSRPHTVPSGTARSKSVEGDRRAVPLAQSDSLDRQIGYAVRHNEYTVRNVRIHVKCPMTATSGSASSSSGAAASARRARPEARR